MKDKIYIVHGFESNINKHWFPWIKEKLIKDNKEVNIINLPNADNPKPDEWLKTIQNEVKEINEKAYFIGHSLGCLGVLHYLQSLNYKSKIGGFILVSGFDKSLKTLPQLDNFINIKLQYEKLINISDNRIVISARNDEIVPTKLTKILAKNLNADFIQTFKGGHFMDIDNVIQMPMVYGILQIFFNN